MKRPTTFIREKRTYCGDSFMTVDLFRYTEEQGRTARKKRKKKEKVSAPKQKNLNDKNARRYLGQLINTNFTDDDFHVTLTYAVQPESKEAADKEVAKFLRRVSYARKKLGIPPLKYILVTEGGDVSKKTGRPTRIHHHIVMNGGIDRDVIENLWRKRKTKGQKQGDMIGYANAKRLQTDDAGLERLANYLSKDPKGKKRWTASQGLKKPERVVRDHHFSCRNFQKACSSGDIRSREWWEKRFKGYTLAGCPELAVEAEPPDDEGLNDWRIYAKLRKIRR